MDGYTILAGLLIFFGFFIYITWFGYSVKVENEKEEGIVKRWDEKKKTIKKNSSS